MDTVQRLHAAADALDAAAAALCQLVDQLRAPVGAALILEAEGLIRHCAPPRRCVYQATP